MTEKDIYERLAAIAGPSTVLELVIRSNPEQCRPEVLGAFRALATDIKERLDALSRDLQQEWSAKILEQIQAGE